RGEEFRAVDFAMLELLEVPPWPRYRFEVEMRHDDRPVKGDSRVGLFFAHQKYADGAEQLLGTFLVTINEANGQGSGVLTPAVAVYRDVAQPPALQRYMFVAPRVLSPEWPPGTPLPWRRIAVEVTSEEVRFFLDDQLQDKFTSAAWKAKPTVNINGQRVEVVP